jgi:hypothetical protein
MPATLVIGRAAIRVCRRYLDRVLIDMIAVHMMQMAIMEVIDMIPVADCCVPA